MAVNVEALVIAEINRVKGARFASADIPENRPARFVTVERTGGPETVYLGRPTLAVQCWDSSRFAASELAAEIADILKKMVTHPQVGRVDIPSIYNFPDISGQARYQLIVNMVTKG